jgi:hypothetical protein
LDVGPAKRPKREAGGNSGSELIMKYYIIKQESDPGTFVEFWASKYRYDDGLEYKYSEEIDKRPLK